MKPLISIITVTYNAASTLPATLRSVGEQTCRNFEHLIIDGASTDATLQLVDEAAITEARAFSSPDKGLYDAMNKGLAKARGEYVVFLNAGDSFHAPTTLQSIADAIKENDFPGVVYGQTDIVDSNRNRIGERHLRAPERLTADSFKHGMLVCHQAFVVKRDITEDYDLRYRFSADYEWCIRCLKKSQSNVYIPEVVIDYLNEGVTTANHRKSLIERFRIMCHYYGTIPTVLRHLKFLFR